MKRILYPVLFAAAALFVACEETDPVQEETIHPVQDICSILTYGRMNSLDSLEYDSQGRVTRYLSYAIEFDERFLYTYDEFTYTDGAIQKKRYSVEDGKTMPGYMFEDSSYKLGENGCIVSSHEVSYYNDAVDQVYDKEYSYNADGQLVKVTIKNSGVTKEDTYTYQNGDLVGDSYGYTYTPSSVPSGPYWPAEFGDVYDVLHWRGLFGKLPLHLPSEWGSVTETLTVNNTYEYEQKDGRLVHYNESKLYKFGNTPSESNYEVFINWKEYLRN